MSKREQSIIFVTKNTREQYHKIKDSLGANSLGDLVGAVLLHKHDFIEILEKYVVTDYDATIALSKSVLESIRKDYWGMRGISIKTYTNAILEHCSNDLDLVTQIWIESKSKGDK